MPSRDEIGRKITEALDDYRLQFDEEAHLIDALTPWGDTDVTQGKRELEILADDLISVVFDIFTDCERERDELVTVLSSVQTLVDQALPKFNWGASALDANAIRLLNDVPIEVRKALAKAKGE